MKKFIQIFITILCVFIMTSCTKFEVKEINKDLRVISYTYADGKIKLINQKFNSNHQAWYDAKCKKVEYKYFKEGFKYNFLNCTKENIIFTKTSLVKIIKLESQKPIILEDIVRKQTERPPGEPWDVEILKISTLQTYKIIRLEDIVRK